MYVLEPATPLARSMVWRLQSTFYGDQGIAAWSQSHVPQSVTTSPNITRAYARVVLGYVRDVQPSLDPAQPLYLVELGAGSGRFAYRFLKALPGLLEQFTEAPPRIVYVMTDAVPSVVAFWRDNPLLQRFVSQGILDFAHFDVLEPSPLQLVQAGQSLRIGDVRNPVVLIGNYIFDSIAQDAFTIRDGQLFENLVTVQASVPELDLTAPDARVRIGITFESASDPLDIDGENDPIVREILRDYAARLDDTTVLLPRRALACLQFFRELGDGRALCLIGDFGDTREDELLGHGPPGFGAGGAFWLPVNFHALGEYARRLGGRARHPRARHVTLNISALLFGSTGLVETDLAYSDAIDAHGPDDLSVLNRALAEHLPSLNLANMLALLRNTGWDPDYVHRAVPRLLEALNENPEDGLQRELYAGVQTAWEQYYPIGETEDVPFSLGVLLYSLGHFEEALAFFERSLQDFGEDPRTTLNLALTLYRLNRLPECLTWLDRTLALDPTNELATQMRPDVANDLANSLC